jgi:Rps23 Pro-64 3,4-dihydroxylase Tpa1-like proline 4-hydroxylase
MIIDDFLSAADHAALLEFALAGEADFAPAMVNLSKIASFAPDSRTAWVYEGSKRAIKDLIKDRLHERLDEMFSGTGTPQFPVERSELELAIYRDGSFYRPHMDTAIGDDRMNELGDRLLSLVYYFHTSPRSFSGGELVIHPIGPGEPDTIDPRDNRLVAFPSIAWHEVKPVVCPDNAFAKARFSINCWLLRKPGQ